MSRYIPIVVQGSGNSERAFDIYSRLLNDRIVFISGPIDDEVSSLVCAQLLYLESEAHDKDIYMYINSPGGSVTSALSIYDTMQFVSCKVSTTCMGLAASAGSLLLTAGAAGQRFSLPNARIMVHQPHGSAFGQASDIQIQANEILYLKDKLIAIYHKHTGYSVSKLQKMLDRDSFISGDEAAKIGIIDSVIDRKTEVNKKKYE